MVKEELIGKWGNIPIVKLKNRVLDNYVYPNDLNKILELRQSIVKCIGVEDDFLVIDSENIIIKISPFIFQSCEKPDFFIGDNVKVINSKGNLEYGIIKDISWRVKYNIYIYWE